MREREKKTNHVEISMQCNIQVSLRRLSIILPSTFFSLHADEVKKLSMIWGTDQWLIS